MMPKPDRSLRYIAKGLQRAELAVSRERHVKAAILSIEPARRVGKPGNRPCAQAVPVSDPWNTAEDRRG
jgi:hypothetical protein